jgi:translocation and assembly module TamA
LLTHRSFYGKFLPGLLFACFLCGGLVWAAEPLDIEIVGIDGDLRENVSAALAPPPGLIRDGVLDVLWLEHFQRRIPARTRAALQPFGYYEAQVEVEGEVTARGIHRLQVRVDPGPPVRLSQVQVAIEGAGRQIEQLRELIDEFPLHPGDVLRHDLYEEAKGRLEARAIDLGFLDAEYHTHVIRVWRTEQRAEIELLLDTGPRYQFGETTLHGAENYPQRFLERYLAFGPGDTFSFERLGQTQLNFLDADRFRQVTIHPRRELAENHQVPVDIELEPLRPKRLRPGIGYGTDTGGRFSLRYRDLNVWELGHEFAAELTTAELRQAIGASYTIPSYRNIQSHTTLRGGFDREDLDLYESSSFFLELERVRAFAGGRTGSAFLRLSQTDFTIGEVDDRTRLVMPGVRFSRRQYRDTVRPLEGYRYILEGRGTSQSLGSDTGLAQVLFGINGLLDLPAGFSIFSRLQGNITLQSDPLEEIPPTLRFFAGGDQSIRGYAFQSLGPQDATGQVVGGKHLLVGSVEIERAFGVNWGVALFYDAGNAFNALDDIEWRQGVGLGLRRYTLVGPIKIDIARQIGLADPSYRLHVSVGFGW